MNPRSKLDCPIEQARQRLEPGPEALVSTAWHGQRSIMTMAWHRFFIGDIVRAHAARRPPLPRTVHSRGDGQFMVSGKKVSRRRRFKPDML